MPKNDESIFFFFLCNPYSLGVSTLLAALSGTLSIGLYSCSKSSIFGLFPSFKVNASTDLQLRIMFAVRFFGGVFGYTLRD